MSWAQWIAYTYYLGDKMPYGYKKLIPSPRKRCHMLLRCSLNSVRNVLSYLFELNQSALNTVLCTAVIVKL